MTDDLANKTTNQVRNIVQKRKITASILKGHYEKLKAANHPDAKFAAVSHALADIDAKSAHAEMEKRNVAWRASVHAKAMSKDNAREPSSNYSGSIAMTEPKPKKTEKEHVKALLDKHLKKESEEDMTDNEIENDADDVQADPSLDTVNPYQSLVQAVFDEKPQAFVDQYNTIIKDIVSQKVAERKLALQNNLFGAPEGLDGIEDEAEQDDPTPEVSGETPEENQPEETEEVEEDQVEDEKKST